MNSLSLMIYLVSIVSNLQVVITAAIASLIAGGVITAFGTLIAHSERYNVAPFMKTAAITWCVLMFTTLIMYVVTPDRSTMVLIAASEVGQKVMTDERVSSIIDPSTELLKTWIQTELIAEKKKLTDVVSGENKK